MPRSVRIEFPGAHYHVMCRGNDGQDIFVTDRARKMFLATLTEVVGQTGWRIHAYCLMSNHYHILLETPEANLVAGMKWFQGTYTQRFNAMFRRRGHLFQGRYKALPVQTDPRDGGLEYFRQISTYIHLNPFRAKLAGVGLDFALEDYEWSSYPLYAGCSVKRPSWLVMAKVLRTWGAKKTPEGLDAYRERLERFMRGELAQGGEDVERFEKQVRRGWYMGSESFRLKLTEMLEGAGGDNFRGAQKRDHSEAAAERYLESGLRLLACSERELQSLRHTQIEKQAIAWLLKEHTTVTGRWIAERLKMGDPSNVARGLARFRKTEDEEVQALKKALGHLVREEESKPEAVESSRAGA